MNLIQQGRARFGLDGPVTPVPDVKQMVFNPPRGFALVCTAGVYHQGPATQMLIGGTGEIMRMLAQSTVIKNKEDRELFSMGRLKANLDPTENVTKGSSFASSQLVALDYDKITPAQLPEICCNMAASGFYYVIHHSFNSTAEAPRIRVIVLLARDAPTGLHAQMHAGLEAIAGVSGDATAGQFAHRFYLGSQPPGSEDWWPKAITGGASLADPDELAAAAPVVAQSVRSSPKALAMALALAVNGEALIQKKGDDRTRDFPLIAKECPLSKAFMDGAHLTYDEWRAVIGILKFCRNGEVLYHQYSALDPRYDRDKAQREWDGWGDDIGPTKCGKSTLHCPGCKHNRTITTPVQLADIDNDGEPVGKRSVDPLKALASAVQAAGIVPVMDTNSVLYLVSTSSASGLEVRNVERASSTNAMDSIVAAGAQAGKPPNKATVETYLAQMRHAGRNAGRTARIYLRVAEVGQQIYKDLGPGRIVRINADGFEVVSDVAEGVPLFSRGTSAGQLPNPEAFASPVAALSYWMKVVLGAFSVTAEDALILMGVVLDWHRTSTPHSPLEITGPAGCGKSTLGDFVLMLVDPAGDGGRVTVGTAGPDMAAAAQQLYVLPIDNAERFDKATSNLLCTVSTGGNMHMRAYYTQGDTVCLQLHRPVIITTVSPVCTAPDLQSRTSQIELPVRRRGFSAESKIRSHWESELPQLQGAICTLLVGALQQLPNVRASGDWGNRMVDGDQLGEAMTRSAGLAVGAYTKAVGHMRERMARRTASGDLFLMALIKRLRDLAGKPTHTAHVDAAVVARGLTPALAVVAYDENRIRITVRPEALHQMMPLSVPGVERNNALPATPRGLTDAIRRVQPMLSGLGINVDELSARGRSVLRFDFLEGAVHEN